jgi:hypothetical protein
MTWSVCISTELGLTVKKVMRLELKSSGYRAEAMIAVLRCAMSTPTPLRMSVIVPMAS